MTRPLPVRSVEVKGTEVLALSSAVILENEFVSSYFAVITDLQSFIMKEGLLEAGTSLESFYRFFQRFDEITKTSFL